MMSQCPIQHDPVELDHRLEGIRLCKNAYTFKTVRYSNFFELITGIESLAKQKIKIDYGSCQRNKNNNTYLIQYFLPKTESNNLLKEMLAEVESAYKQDIEDQQESWLDAQLKEALAEERLVEQHLQAEAEKAFKNKLLQKYKESQNAV